LTARIFFLPSLVVCTVDSYIYIPFLCFSLYYLLHVYYYSLLLFSYFFCFICFFVLIFLFLYSHIYILPCWQQYFLLDLFLNFSFRQHLLFCSVPLHRNTLLSSIRKVVKSNWVYCRSFFPVLRSILKSSPRITS
jgi:hypothetical protein